MKIIGHSILILLLLFVNSAHTQNNSIIVKTQHSKYNWSSLEKWTKNTKPEPVFPQHYKKGLKGNPGRLSNIYNLEITSESMHNKLLKQLQQDPEVIYAVEKPKVYLFDTTNDPSIGQQYYLGQINAFAAWDVEKGDSTTIIGIIDTGTDFTHEDLNGKIAKNYADPVNGIDDDLDGFIDNFSGWDLSENNNNPQADIDGHGVRVAGIAAAAADNTIGIAGVGRDIRYLPIKVMNSYGQLNTAWEGIVYAADHDVDVAVCSWGGIVESPFARDIIEYAIYDQDMLIVAAAGNSGNEYLYYPAAYEDVLAVAATNPNDQKWASSTYGYHVDIAAPGDGIFSTTLGNGYGSGSGTSYAAPAAGAVAALVRHQRPHLSALQVMQQIKNTTFFLDTIPQNVIYADKLGSGRLDAYNALTDTLISGIDINEMQINGVPIAGDTVFLEGALINYLQSASAMIEVTSMSEHATVLNESINAGILNTNETYLIDGETLPIKITQNAPYNEMVTIKFTIDDGQNSYERFFSFIANQSYTNLTQNNLNLTVPANGRLGFNQMYPLQGKGIWLDNYTNMVWEAGLIYGNSTNEVISSFMDVPELHTISIADTSIADEEKISITSEMIDTNKVNSMNIKTIQTVTAVSDAELSSTIFIHYDFVNKSSTSYNDFHAGLFFDWDLVNYAYNKMFFDETHQIAYCENIVGNNLLTGLKVHDQPFHHYAFELEDDTEGINIIDGFTDEERWFALSNERQEAGSGMGEDVAHLVGTESMVLGPSDTVSITIMLTSGFHFSDITDNMANAENFLNNATSIAEKNEHASINIYPQPAEEIVTIVGQEEMLRIQIFNLHGQLIRDEQVSGTSILLNTSDLPSGLYHLRIQNVAGSTLFTKLMVE